MTEVGGTAPSAGQVYLEEVTQRFEVGDEVAFEHSPIDELIANSGRLALKENMNLGVQGFLNEFAEVAQQQAQDRRRWSEGKGLPGVTDEVKELISTKTPKHLVINPEAFGGIQIRPAPHYKIDIVSDDIMAQIAALLPRKIDAYHYKQGYAEETIEVPGLGEVQVKMHDSSGIFKSINQVRVGNFCIWNCRQTGLWYNGNLIDNSRPTSIELDDSEKTHIQLYDDESGIFIQRNGKMFTNARWKTRAGSGYGSDYLRDELYRTYNGGNEMSSIREGQAPNKGWRDDTTEYSWKQVQDQAIVWMAENILFPLKQALKPEGQATELPEDEPYPFDKIGPIFTFIETQDLERVARIKDNPTGAYPEERQAIHPGQRLVPYDMSSKDLPSGAHDGYIYAKPGVILDMDPSSVKKIGHEWRRTDNMLGNANGFAQIRPKSAREVYVVDWAEWQKFRDSTFSESHDRLTDAEMCENYAVVARTMTPVTEYDGSFAEPLVIIGRELELDEIEALVPAPPKSY